MDPSLGKYPIMLVKGERISFEQADELLIRTNDWDDDSIDHIWTDTVYSSAGIQMGTLNIPHPDSLSDFKKAYRVLDLEYTPNHRIMTRHILGPRGWADWDGLISYQLPTSSKWPLLIELEHEWRDIAAAFPFLDLKVQFAEQKIDNTLGWGEIDAGIKPTFRIRVKDGDIKADYEEAGFKRMDIKYKSKDDVRTMVRRHGSHLGRQGVPLTRLREALDRVKPL